MGFRDSRDSILVSETLTIPGGTATLQGLDLDAMIFIAKDHFQDLSDIFETVMAQAQGDEESFKLSSLIQALLSMSPGLAATIIAVAAGEHAQVDVVRRLTFPLQIEALEKIGRLTFGGEDGLKNFAEIVIRVAKGITGGINLLSSPSPAGSETSGSE